MSHTSIDKKLTIKYSALQGAYWLLAAAGMAFMTPILQDKGFSSIEIGCLNAVKFLSVIIFQTIFAVYLDRYPGPNKLKAMMLLLSGGSIFSAYLLYEVGHSFLVALFIFILYGATVNCLSAIVDSLSLQYMNSGRSLFYGASRASGSLCWAFACVGLGFFADSYGNDSILLLEILLTLLFMVVAYCMDPVDGSVTSKNQENERAAHSAIYILTHYHKYTFYLLLCVFLSMGYTLNTTFLVNRFTDLGGGTGLYGFGEFVLAMSEIPAALCIGRLMKRFSLEQLALFSGIFSTLRAAAVTFAPTIATLILGQTFEIGGLAIYYVVSVYIVRAYLPEGDVVKGVSFINTAMMGVGQSVASFFCGILLEKYGLYGLMYISIALSAVSICFGIAMIYCRNRTKIS